MNSISTYNDIYKSELIKVFVKLVYPEIKRKDIYEIDESKKIITLYNKETDERSIEEKLYHFEFDKIFLNSDSNSYIYEEICLNCIKQCYEGTSFSFISFGETSSNKFDLLFGKINKDYTNINNHGIFIRYLTQMNEENKKYNYNIKLSSMLIYGDNLIDLFDIFNPNKKHKIRQLSDLMKNSIKINKDPSIIEQISKTEYNDNIDTNKIPLFLSEIITSLLNLDTKGNNYIYSLCNICFIIYLEDQFQNTVSTSTFLLLNGSEHIYDIKKQNLNKKEENSKSETLKNLLDIHTMYDGIINCIRYNKYIMNSTKSNISSLERRSSKKLVYKKYKNEKLPKKDDKGINEELSKYSKLIIVLYNICFSNNIKNIKFRIIGNIRPILEYFKITRDTLLFCSTCFKIINKTKTQSTLSEELKKRFDVEDLNFQIKLQRKQIDTLNHTLEKKNIHINFLSNHYNAQINAIKKYFCFNEDPNILITDDVDLEENNYMKRIRHKIKEQEKEIEESKEKIKELEHELFKYKNIFDIKNNDETMMNYYLSIKNNETIKNAENKLINSLSKEIKELNEQMGKKDKVIEGLKKDLNEKSKILCNLHKIKNTKKKENEKNENEKEKENEKGLKSICQNLENEIKKMKINEEKKIAGLKNKFNTILEDKKNEMFFIQQRLDGIENVYKEEIETLNKELVGLYEIILELINGYQNLFEVNNLGITNINNNKKKEFDKNIINRDKEINQFKFASLYKELKKQNKTKQMIIESLTKEKMDDIQNIIKNNIDQKKEPKKKDKLIISAKEMEISELNNKLLSMSHYLKEQVKQNNNNNIIINSQKLTIEKMKKSSLLYENLLKNKSKRTILKNKASSPTLIKKRILGQNFMKNLDLTNNSNNIGNFNIGKNILGNLSLINESSIKSENYDSSISNRKKIISMINKTKEKKD